MGILKLSLIIILSPVIFSCAKLQYVIEQGQGQLAIFYDAKSNQELLADGKIASKYKDKIKYIEELRKYFYQYFNEKSSDIYTKTTLLERDAVSYLVIASLFDKIEAKEACFWFVGCFPYLGFFSKDRALDYAKELAEQNYVTWVRPVYAYSSLGYFDDPILSSFFAYDDFDLTEMIFHELFHSIFFIKDEVELNENLANFFGRELALAYFKFDSAASRAGKLAELAAEDRLKEEILAYAQRLIKLYQVQRPSKQEESEAILKEFLIGDFYPQVKKICTEFAVSETACFPLRGEWNNARFAAFLTYEKEQNRIYDLYKKSNKSLIEFYKELKQKKERGENLFL